MTDFLVPTPLILLPCPTKTVRILGKAEWFHPTGSIKERTAAFLLQDAQQRSALSPGGTIVEATSGNLGIALAALAKRFGYSVKIVMPDSMPEERQQQLSVLGADVILTPHSEGMAGSIQKAKELASSIQNSCFLDQFRNPAGVQAHFSTTGPEIWSQSEGKADILIAGVGTGGTLTGIGRYLKTQKPEIQIVAVEPAESSVLSGNAAGFHGIVGIGAGLIPPLLDWSLLSEILPIATQEAYWAARQLSEVGFPVGISAGAAYHAACLLALRPENSGKCIVCILPDGADRYHSLGL